MILTYPCLLEVYLRLAKSGKIVYQDVKKFTVAEGGKTSHIFDAYVPSAEKTGEKYVFRALYKSGDGYDGEVESARVFYAGNPYKKTIKNGKAGNIFPCIFRKIVNFVRITIEKNIFIQ